MEQYTIQEYLDFQKWVRNENRKLIANDYVKLHFYKVQVLWRRIYISSEDISVYYDSNEKLRQQYQIFIRKFLSERSSAKTISATKRV